MLDTSASKWRPCTVLAGFPGSECIPRAEQALLLELLEDEAVMMMMGHVVSATFPVLNANADILSHPSLSPGILSLGSIRIMWVS